MSKKKLYLQDLMTERGPTKTNTEDPVEREFIAEERSLTHEARRLRLEELIARRNRKIDEMTKKGKTEKEISQAGNEFFKGILDVAKVDPARAKQFLDSLSQEDILKINSISTSGSSGSIQALLPLIKNEGTKIQDIVAIVKMMQPPPEKPTTISEVAMLMKTFKEMDKSPPQTNIYETLVTKLLDEARATREERNKDHMMRYEKELSELKNRPTFAQELAAKKAEMEAYKETFGGGTGQNIEVTKMQMGQKRWEMEETWKRTKEMAELTQQKTSDKEKLDLIKTIAVPAIEKLGPIISNAVNLGKQHKNGSPGGKKVSTKQAATSFLCPECAKNSVQTLIDVSGNPDVAVCPNKECGAKFPKQQT